MITLSLTPSALFPQNGVKSKLISTVTPSVPIKLSSKKTLKVKPAKKSEKRKKALSDQSESSEKMDIDIAPTNPIVKPPDLSRNTIQQKLAAFNQKQKTLTNPVKHSVATKPTTPSETYGPPQIVLHCRLMTDGMTAKDVENSVQHDVIIPKNSSFVDGKQAVADAFGVNRGEYALYKAKESWELGSMMQKKWGKSKKKQKQFSNGRRIILKRQQLSTSEKEQKSNGSISQSNIQEEQIIENSNTFTKPQTITRSAIEQKVAAFKGNQSKTVSNGEGKDSVKDSYGPSTVSSLENKGESQSPTPPTIAPLQAPTQIVLQCRLMTHGMTAKDVQNAKQHDVMVPRNTEFLSAKQTVVDALGINPDDYDLYEVRGSWNPGKKIKRRIKAFEKMRVIIKSVKNGDDTSHATKQLDKASKHESKHKMEKTSKPENHENSNGLVSGKVQSNNTEPQEDRNTSAVTKPQIITRSAIQQKIQQKLAALKGKSMEKEEESYGPSLVSTVDKEAQFEAKSVLKSPPQKRVRFSVVEYLHFFNFLWENF